MVPSGHAPPSHHNCRVLSPALHPPCLLFTPENSRGLSWGPGQPLWPFGRAPKAVMQGSVQTLLCQAFGKVHTDSDVQKLCFTRLWDVLADYKVTVYYSPSTTNLARVKMDSNSLSTSLLAISSSIHIMFRSWVLIVESNGLIM